jgi:hypothetical protein
MRGRVRGRVRGRGREREGVRRQREGRGKTDRLWVPGVHSEGDAFEEILRRILRNEDLGEREVRAAEGGEQPQPLPEGQLREVAEIDAEGRGQPAVPLEGRHCGEVVFQKCLEHSAEAGRGEGHQGGLHRLNTILAGGEHGAAGRRRGGEGWGV